MVESFAELKNQLQQLWGGLEKKVKIIIGVSVLFTVIGLVILATWAGRPEYKTLFNNLSAKDAGQIVEKLKEENVTYKIEDNGSTILVPKGKVHDLRLSLASEGIPAGGVTGFEIFDRTKLGSTDFEQKVNFYRALSGELSRTIKQIDKVSYARVQITPAKESIYQDNEQPSKASVLLKLKEYEQLSTKEIRSIANLVASSVNDLSPDRVTIVDSQSNLLSAKLEDESGEANVSDRLELKQRVETQLEKDLNVMLTKVLGMNDFVVTVNADLNFDQQNIKSEEYQPVVGDEGVVRSRQTKEESEEGTTSNPEGVPGTTSNIPQYRIQNEQQQNREKEEEIVNYEINKKIEEYIKAPGNVERLSVSVMVNTEGELAPQREQAITKAVSAAVGYDEQRGDEISVIGMPFDQSLEEEASKALAAEQNRRDQLMLALAVGIGVLILLGVILLLRRGRGSEEEQQPERDIDYVVEEAEEEFAVSTELGEEEKERQKLIQQLRNLATDQPGEIAELIKSWMGEG